jgi:xylose isomerase
VREALGGHGIYCVASGLHLDPRFGKGGLCSPDDATRDEALRLTLDAVDWPGELGAHFIIWPGDRGLQLPVPDARTPSRGPASSTAIAARRSTLPTRGVTIFLEHKNSEPAMKILMRNIGMTLHVIHTLRARDHERAGQHGLAAPDHERREPRRVRGAARAEGLLGHQHANSGWGTFDDDNMVGATAFMETIELAIELRRAATATTASGSASTLPLHRGRVGPSAVGAAVAVHRRIAAKIDGRRCVRRSTRRRGARLRARLRGVGL